MAECPLVQQPLAPQPALEQQRAESDRRGEEELARDIHPEDEEEDGDDPECDGARVGHELVLDDAEPQYPRVTRAIRGECQQPCAGRRGRHEPDEQDPVECLGGPRGADGLEGQDDGRDDDRVRSLGESRGTASPTARPTCPRRAVRGRGRRGQAAPTPRGWGSREDADSASRSSSTGCVRIVTDQAGSGSDRRVIGRARRMGRRRIGHATPPLLGVAGAAPLTGVAQGTYGVHKGSHKCFLR